MPRKVALVIGAGMSGLLTARVLSKHYERVVVIDRDELPDGLEPRSGVPQARHTHVLLSRGATIVEQYLPGLQNDLRDAGAPAFNFGQDLKFRTYYGWAVRPFEDYPTHRCTRGVLEACVRRRVRMTKNIEFVPKTTAKNLAMRNGTVVGVETSHGQIDADLTVEASGKASRFEDWLKAMGYMLPKQSVVDGLCGYGTLIFKQPPAPPNRDWRGLYIQGAAGKPGGSRGGSLFPIEGNRWQVTVAGVGRDYPPVDVPGFLDYIRNFRTPYLYDAIKDAEPLTQVYGSRSTENRHLHLERATTWPAGFMVVGDAAVHLNPVYAQGMTLASLAAEALDDVLARSDDQVPQRFHKALDRVIQDAWALATAMDLQVPGYEGDPQPPGFAVVAYYMDRLMRLAPKHNPTARRFAKVLHLLKSPASLMTPMTVFHAVTEGRFVGATAREHDEIPRQVAATS